MDQAKLIRNWPLVLIAIVWFCVFWQMNTGQTVVGFRDSAYLYYPYFQWIDQQWATGHIPLWNPYCDLGHPVVADGTSSVFYPGKLVFLCRFLSYPSRYGCYLSIHVLWAAVGAYWLTKRLGASSEGAGIAAVSYSFGGSVLFQCANVIYLVSAAWLPFAMLFVWQMFKWRSTKHAVYAGAACAMMVLGGDPQMAYVAGTIAVGTLSLRLVSSCRHRLIERRLWCGNAWVGIRLCATMAIAMAALSAVQVLPTYFWSQQSERNATLENQAHAVYQFSQPPWSLTELVWPNISGKPFPVYQRWSDRLPGADRIWTPSLYCGGLVLMLAVCGFQYSGPRRKFAWLTWVASFFAIASFGWYGVGWLYHEIAIGLGLGNASENETAQLQPFVGGLYWAMTMVLPKFAMFRYPAKLFVVASLFICVLAGLNLHRLSFRRLVVFSVGMLFASCAAYWCLVSGQLFKKVPEPHVLFGPFASELSYTAVQASLLHALILLAVFFVLYSALLWQGVLNGNGRGKNGAVVFAILFFVTIADLLVANRWLVSQISATVFTEPSQAERRFEENRHGGFGQATRDFEHPMNWRTKSSVYRLEEVVNWQRNSLHPKHHLSLPVRMVGSFSSIEHPVNAKFAREVDRLAGSSFSFGTGKQERQDKALRFGVRENALSKFSLVGRDEEFAGKSVGEFWGVSRTQDCGFELLKQSCNQLEVHVSSQNPVVLLYAGLNDGGWDVQVESNGHQQTAFLRPNDAGVFSVEVPAGESVVKFRYSPKEFWVGLWVSVVGWLAVFIFFAKQFATQD